MTQTTANNMDTQWAEAYKEELAAALVRRRVWDRRILEEVHAHLLDSATAGVRDGLSPAEAQARALERMGEPAEVARAALISQQARFTPWAFGFALILGIVLAWVATRLTWGNTAFLAIAITLPVSYLSALIPGKAWLWALTIGGFLPIATAWVNGSYGGLLALAAAAFAALVGVGTQRLLRPD